jgi:hypothetical protein
MLAPRRNFAIEELPSRNSRRLCVLEPVLSVIFLLLPLSFRFCRSAFAVPLLPWRRRGDAVLSAR